ncbi:MAG: 3-deoxy-manno-octulosonate cytidylyltransferase [Sphingobacteriales bacterium]|nr:MAG: 3-deoxy-manno-octulosonate cytidylyltransferase [Sphingobacteriales bacterium]
MKLLGIIPARFASTRLPGKPLAMIQGKSMIQHVYERVKASNIVDKIFIATDDERIINTAASFGAEAIMTSPLHNSGTDRCAEVAAVIGYDFDVVINIQGDEPFIETDHLKSLRDLFLNDEVQIGSLIKRISSLVELKNPNVVKAVKTPEGKALYFSRSVVPYIRNIEEHDWLHHHSFYKHIGLYGYRKETLLKIAQLSPAPLEQVESLEQLRWLENNISIHLAETFIETLSIDTPEDLIKANDSRNG